MNKYEIDGVIGEGAYGIVYKAQHKETGELGKFFILKDMVTFKIKVVAILTSYSFSGDKKVQGDG